MISLMSKQSLRSSRMRNTFVMVTIVLASALLTAILMFAMGQKQETKNELSHRQQAGYYNLTAEQVETLKKDERIACQIQVKTGILSEMDGFDVKPYYVSELTDQIQIGELESGRLPEKENEIAVMEEKMAAGVVDDELLRKYGETQKQLEKAMVEWEVATEDLEQMRTKY